jgi:hypothetical protein
VAEKWKKENGLIYGSHSGNESRGMECCAVQWEGAVWLRRMVTGKEMVSDFPQFISIFTVEVVQRYDCFIGFFDMGMESMNIY